MEPYKAQWPKTDKTGQNVNSMIRFIKKIIHIYSLRSLNIRKISKSNNVFKFMFCCVGGIFVYLLTSLYQIRCLFEFVHEKP